MKNISKVLVMAALSLSAFAAHAEVEADACAVRSVQEMVASYNNLMLEASKIVKLDEKVAKETNYETVRSTIVNKDYNSFYGFADASGMTSTKLFNYRRDNANEANIDQAFKVELGLDRLAIAIRGGCIRL